jgi:hypothetical protein
MPPDQSIRDIIQSLRAHVRTLEKRFPGRKFTLDGHLVGSIGEVLAAEMYDLELLPPSSEQHDARSKDGRLVQIKLTQGNMVGLRADCDHLIVLKLNSDGVAEEVFNGPGAPVWDAAGKMQKNGQRPIALSRLMKLVSFVQEKDRLPTRP